MLCVCVCVDIEHCVHETKVINFASPLLLSTTLNSCVSLSTVHTYVWLYMYVWWCVCVLLADGKHLRQREGWQRWVVQGQTPGQPGFPPGPGEEFCNGHLPALTVSWVVLALGSESMLCMYRL